MYNLVKKEVPEQRNFQAEMLFPPFCYQGVAQRTFGLGSDDFFFRRTLMKNRSLVLGFAVFIGAVLIFGGCESPTEGQGKIGPSLAQPGQEITPEVLANWFKTANTVVLPAYPDGETTISGVIPSGKTLVLGGDFVLKQQTATVNGSTEPALTVQGELVLKEDSALDAGYYNAAIGGIASGAGWLKLDRGYLSGEGTVMLPYIESGTSNVPAGLVHYRNAPGDVKKLPASYIATNASGPVTELTHAGLVAIFKLLEGDSTAEPIRFTTKIRTTLTDNEDVQSDYAVPARMILTLKGDGNIINGTVAGQLIVDGTLTKNQKLELPSGGQLRVNGTLMISNSSSISNILIGEGGVLDLGESGSIVGTITNNGVIKSASSDVDTVKAIIGMEGLSGNGSVALSGEVDLSGENKSIPLKQNLVIAGVFKAPDISDPLFSGTTDKTKLTIAGTGALDLGAAANITGIGISSANITNSGTVKTTTTTAIKLKDLLGLIPNGTISIDTSVEVGSGETFYASDLVVSNPDGAHRINLTGSITVNGGTLIALDTATPFASGTVINITSGTLELKAKNFIFSGVNITNNGKIITPTESGRTLNTILGLGGEVEATASVTGDYIVVPGGAKLTVASGKTLLVSGTITVKDGGTFNDISCFDDTSAGKVVFESGAKGGTGTAEIAGDGGYVWPSGSSNAKITVTSGTVKKTEISGGAVEFAGLDIADNLVIAEGAALTLSAASSETGEVEVMGSLTVDGALVIPAGVTLADHNEKLQPIIGTVTVKGGAVETIAGGTLDSTILSESFPGKVVFENGSTGKSGNTANIVGISKSKSLYRWLTNSTAKLTLQNGVTTLSGEGFNYYGSEINGAVIVDTGTTLTISNDDGYKTVLLKGSLSVYGTLDIANSETLKLADWGDDGTPAGSLQVNGTINVFGGLDATCGALSVYGTITVVERGTITVTAGTGVPEIAGGKIVLEYGARGLYGTTPVIGRYEPVPMGRQWRRGHAESLCHRAYKRQVHL
jgi:hypothetical protein